MQKVITPPITGRLTGRAELNKIMLRQIYAVNNADPSAKGLKFIEICRDKRGWHLKPRHFVVVEGISSLQCFLRRKLHFQNILGVYKVVGFPLKEKWQGKQHLEVTEWKIRHESHSKSVFFGLFRAKAKRLPRRYSTPSRMGSGPGFETARLRSAEKHRKSTMSCKMN